MNKKGILTANILQFVMSLFLMIAVVLSIIMLGEAYFNFSIRAFNQESVILNNRIYYTEGVVEYDEVSDRLYPGRFMFENISKTDFSSKLSELIFYGDDNQHIAARIALQGGGKQAVTYLNPGRQNGYDEVIVLAESGIPGLGGASKRQYLVPNILYLSDGEMKTGVINITVTMRNS